MKFVAFTLDASDAIKVISPLPRTHKSKAIRVLLRDHDIHGGMECVSCGLRTSVFRFERETLKRYTWAAYGEKKNGKLVRMTFDHIVPRSLGGSDSITNGQCMCYECNQRKGNSITLTDMIAAATHHSPHLIWNVIVPNKLQKSKRGKLRTLINQAKNFS